MSVLMKSLLVVMIGFSLVAWTGVYAQNGMDSPNNMEEAMEEVEEDSDCGCSLWPRCKSKEEPKEEPKEEEEDSGCGCSLWPSCGDDEDDDDDCSFWPSCDLCGDDDE